MKVIEGIHFQTGKHIQLTMDEGHIVDIEEIPAHNSDCVPPFIAPGLVDLQINGYLGRDFNTLPINEGMVQEITHTLWQMGVTAYFPTVITNSVQKIQEAITGIVDACNLDKDVDSTIAGIHVEGPFISSEDGPRGAHPKEYVRAPDWDLFRQWQAAAKGRIKIITLSPEWSNSIDFITKCVESGVTVSIGHTAATPEQIREAVAAGARMSTHLGNGAHASLPRHPNYIWEQLAMDELWACVIGDAIHLPDAVLKTILKVKGKRTILVSDVVSINGTEPGEYNLHIGGRLILTPEGRLSLADSPKLTAGSIKMLTWGIEHLVRSGLCQLTEAWELASMNPATFMDLPSRKGIQISAQADIVIFDWTAGKIHIKETYKKGIKMYETPKGKIKEEKDE